MRRSMCRVCSILALIVLAASEPAWARQAAACPEGGREDVVYVRGEVERPLELTARELERLPRTRLRLEGRDGRPVEYEGVALLDLIAHAGVPTDRLRGPQAAAVVVAEARDGYRAVFALAELDEAFSDRLVVLVDRKDGAALAPEEGPFRVVMRGEQRHSRWIRQVSCLRVARP